MATSKEAIVLLLDVGSNMGLPCNERNETYFEVALDCIKSIVSRKVRWF